MCSGCIQLNYTPYTRTKGYYKIGVLCGAGGAAEESSHLLHTKSVKYALKILYLQNIDSYGVIINNRAKYNYIHKYTNKGRKRVMEDNAQNQSKGQMSPRQLDFSGQALPEKDIPEQLTFSGRKILPDTDISEKVDPLDKEAPSEQDILEPSLSLGQQAQGSEAVRSLAQTGQRTLARPLSSDTSAALRTFLSVLAQPPIPKLPQSPGHPMRSSRRQLPVALIGISAVLAVIVLLMVFLLPASNAPQHSGKIVNAPATTTTGKSTPPTGATTPPGKGTQPPTANNPTQPPADNGGNAGTNPPPNTGTNPGTNPGANPTPIPVTPIPVANSGVLTVTPGVVHVNNVCSAANGGFHCVLTVAPVPGRTDLTLWNAIPENLGLPVIFPLSTVIAPGHQQQVTVTLPQCVNGGDIRFVAEGVAAVVPFIC